MTPDQMLDTGIRALREGETGRLSREAAALTALAWAACAWVKGQVTPDDSEPERDTQLDALVDHADDIADAPRIGFRTFQPEHREEPT